MSEDELEDLDTPLSYEEFILTEDFRSDNGGSFYYRINRYDNEFITLRMILDQLKDNKICSGFIDNENNVLVSINKRTELHYILHFDNNLELT